MTFKELEFKPRVSRGLWDSRGYTCFQALVNFDNGFSLSILKADKTGPHKYCQAKENSYEIAILKNGSMYYDYSDKDRQGHGVDKYDLDQDSFDGVWIYQPESKVEELLNIVSKFDIDGKTS